MMRGRPQQMRRGSERRRKPMKRQKCEAQNACVLPFVPGALSLACVLLSGAFISGCTPRVELAAPEKPITINMNIKIDHEVKVRVDRDLDEVINKDSKLF